MATFTVTTNADSVDAGDSLLSLREAIGLAAQSAGADTITFAPSVKGQTIALTDTLAIAGGENLVINGDVDDDGMADITISTAGNTFFNHLDVGTGATVKLIGLDFINGGENTFNNPGTNGPDGNDGAPVAGGTGLPGSVGDHGIDGGAGQQAVGAIFNLGTLELIRVGFGNNTAQASRGGDGGEGGRGGDGTAGANGADGADNTELGPRNETATTGPNGHPRSPAEQEVVKNYDFVLPIEIDWRDPGSGTIDRIPGSIFNSNPHDSGGQPGTAGGVGGAGGDGAKGGDGGSAAGAILNGVGGVLTLTDVAFGGRLVSGIVTNSNSAIGGNGGVGGTSGPGGFGGNGGAGGDGGQHWTEVYSFLRQPLNGGYGAFSVAYFIGKNAGIGGAGGVGGNEGDDGLNGNGGNAARGIINQGLVSGLAAVGGFDTTLRGGTGGASLPNLDRSGFNNGGAGTAGGKQADGEWREGVGFSSISNGGGNSSGTTTPGEPRNLPGAPTLAEAAHGANGAKGLTGEDGSFGAPGVATNGIQSEKDGNSDGSATIDTIVYLHALPRDHISDAVTFNVIRIGSTAGTVNVNWNISGVGTNPVEASDFVGGVLPSGALSLAPGDAFKQVQVQLANPDAHETYQIEITGVSLATAALGTHVQVGDTSGNHPRAFGDFNGDGKSDLLFQANGGIFQRQMNDRLVDTQGPVGAHDPAFSVQVVGDFDGDGKSDVAFRNPTTGGVYAWLLDGTTIKSQGAVDVADPAYHLLGTADLNGDGKADLIFRSDAGVLYEWQMDGLDNTPMAIGPLSPNWRVQGAGDFDGDGKADLLLRDLSGNADEGGYYLWEMNGNVIKAEGGIDHTPTDWTTLGTGDFDGDGKTDVALRNVGGGVSDGVVWIWLMNGTTIASQGVAGFAKAADFDLAGIGDYNGDGKDDILFRNEAGSLYSWNMNGTHIASEGAVPWASPDQHIVGQHWELFV